jgi:1-acyl-sn-glycerol-3-phosphate acyltransferase
MVALGAGQVVLLPIPPGRRAVRRAVFGTWARGVARLLGIRIAVEGTVPAPPFVLVSNHLSYLDIVVYAARTPARFVAKSDVRRWPVIGALAGAVGTIFIDRTNKRDAVRVLDDLARAVEQGDGIVLFAEATSTAGHTVLPFRPALLEWAAQTGHPVHYASIAYRTPAGAPPAHLAVCWWGEMTFGRHLVALSRLPRIDATIRHGTAPIAETDRKRLADRLHRAVTATFTPVVTEQG